MADTSAPASAALKPGATASETHVLQGLLWPEQGLTTERDLFLRLSDRAAWSESAQCVEMLPGGIAGLDTAFNLFNLGKWQVHCGLSDLRLRLTGAGRMELVVTQVLKDRSWERLMNEIITLSPGEPLEIDLAAAFDVPVSSTQGGVLAFTLKALTEARLDAAEWVTSQVPKRTPRITLSITTFRREAAVRAAVARFENFLATSPIAPHLHLQVVDNGQSAEIAASAHVTPILNENLGGAGGFARGLLEAEARGATHCLFMDDDASIPMAAVERTWTFLAHATDPATAVAAGLLSARHRWAMWENGACFDRVCQPLHMGTDLRDFGQVAKMELVSTPKAPANLYGGWWFFAFPIATAQYRPFPYFVRGDDVSFSLANPFNIVTLPGVVSSQEADFSEKENPLTVYLDLRSHISHHLALPQMNRGRAGTMKTPLIFFLRALIQCKYETLEAINLALDDVMAGPDFFATNADMAERRARLGKMRVSEVWRPLEGAAPVSRKRLNPNSPVTRWLMKLTLNGHLLPFFRRFGNRLVLAPGEGGSVRTAWGTAEFHHTDGTGKTMVLRHSKRAALQQGLRFAGRMLRFARAYPQLCRDWQAGYGTLTSNRFWAGLMRIEAPAPASDPAPARQA